VLHLTDGAPADRRYFPAFARDMSRPAYARVRRDEACRALALAGVAEAQVACLGLRDQEAAFALVAATEYVFSTVARLGAEIVITHAYEGGHPDHDAAAFAVQNARAIAEARGCGGFAVVEMTGYHDRGGVTVRGEFLPREPACGEIALDLDEDQRRRKRSMFAAYASQHAVLEPFRLEVERFRVAPVYDFRAPPHDGRLHYERFGIGMSGAMWRGLARAAKRKLPAVEE